MIERDASPPDSLGEVHELDAVFAFLRGIDIRVSTATLGEQGLLPHHGQRDPLRPARLG